MTTMRRQQKSILKQVEKDADALFLGSGIRAIARKTLPPGFTAGDIKQFLEWHVR
jgi:hypothetical protein